jgi:hypothetical protein
MACQKVHARLPPLHRFSTRAISTCGTVWWWTPDWEQWVTDDLDEVTCRRCIYILKQRGILIDRQLILPGFSVVPRM